MTDEPTQGYYEAYYYSLTPTGDPTIDAILEAVADAGKAYHHTGDWSDKTHAEELSPIERIQEAANDAAKALPLDWVSDSDLLAELRKRGVVGQLTYKEFISDQTLMRAMDPDRLVAYARERGLRDLVRCLEDRGAVVAELSDVPGEHATQYSMSVHVVLHPHRYHDGGKS